MLKRIFLLPVLGTLLMCSPLLSLSSNKSVTVKADSSDVVFKKVTTSIADNRGTYLIVNESNNKVFNSSLTPSANKDGNSLSVTIDKSGDVYKIVNPSSDILNAAVTIERDNFTDGAYKYYVKLANGEYLTYGGSTGEFDEATSPTTSAILFDSYSLKMKIDGTSGGGNRFAYKSSDDKFAFYNSYSDCQLYKLDSISDTDYNTYVTPYITSMNTFKSKCPNGITESDWDTANSGTSSFTADVFGYLGNVTYVHDTETSGSLKDCIDLYDYIVSKYGYTDYLKRKGSSAYQDNYNHSNKVVPLVGDNNVTNNGIWLSVIVSSLVVTSLITFLVIKRYRKD